MSLQNNEEEKIKYHRIDNPPLRSFTWKPGPSDLVKEVTPILASAKTHGEFMVDKKGSGKKEKDVLRTINFKDILPVEYDGSTKNCRLFWVFFVFPGLAAFHQSSTSTDFINRWKAVILDAILNQDNYDDIRFKQIIQNLQYNYLLEYIVIITPGIIELFKEAINECKELWTSEIEGDMLSGLPTELDSDDVKPITKDYHKWMEIMADCNNILCSLAFDPPNFISLAIWNSKDPNCPKIPVKKLLTDKPLISQNNDWNITLESLPNVKTTSLGFNSQGYIPTPGVIANVFTQNGQPDPNMQFVLPNFIYPTSCFPKGEKGDMFIMSDVLQRQMFQTTPFGIGFDGTCGHARKQYRGDSYAVVDKTVVKNLQNQFDDLISKISIKITPEQAEEISRQVKELLASSSLLLLLQQNQQLVLDMSTLMKTAPRPKIMSPAEKTFMSLYYNAFQYPDELREFLQANLSTDASVMSSSVTMESGNEEELGGSRHKRSRRRKHGSNKKIRNRAKKTNKKSHRKRRTKKRIRK